MSSADVLPRAVDLLQAHTALLAKVRQSQQLNNSLLASAFPAATRPSPVSAVLALPLPDVSHTQPPSLDRPPSPASPKRALPDRPDLPPAKRARMAKYKNYVPEEETIRNDYSQHYVDTGEWPQNYVQGAELERRFEEYPKQRRLLQLKKDAVAASAHPPTYLPFPLSPSPSSASSLLTRLTPLKFDVILLDPFHSSHTWTWDELLSLPIPQLAGDPSFVFMWVGNGSDDGLERGREVLARWGYRRAEDIVWIRTNKGEVKGPGGDEPTTSLLTHTKQHCLMGIRGTVRRSTDAWFVHCNIDTDVIIWEGDPADPTRKPPELYSLIENFCMGMRRLELFGRPSSLRPGWLTVGEDFERFSSNSFSPDKVEPPHDLEKEGLLEGAVEWTLESYEANFTDDVRNVVQNSAEIESLRPKSPTRGNASGPTLLAPPPNAQRAVPRPAPGQATGGHFSHPGPQGGGPMGGGIPLGQQGRPMGGVQGGGMQGGMGMGIVPAQAQGGFGMMPGQDVFLGGGQGMHQPQQQQQGAMGMGMLNGPTGPGGGMGMPGMMGGMGAMPGQGMRPVPGMGGLHQGMQGMGPQGMGGLQGMQGMGAMQGMGPMQGMQGMNPMGMGNMGMQGMNGMGGMGPMGPMGMPMGGMGMGGGMPGMNMAGMGNMPNMPGMNGMGGMQGMGNMGMGMGMPMAMNMPGMQGVPQQGMNVWPQGGTPGAGAGTPGQGPGQAGGSGWPGAGGGMGNWQGGGQW